MREILKSRFYCEVGRFTFFFLNLVLCIFVYLLLNGEYFLFCLKYIYLEVGRLRSSYVYTFVGLGFVGWDFLRRHGIVW